MANRRCISKDFYDSDEFCKLSAQSKVLYTQLILHCDDDGVVINPKAVMIISGAKPRNLEELLSGGFLLRVDNVFVVKHWFLHNKVQPTRKHDSIYRKELSKLCINKHKEYEVFDDKLSTICRPNLNKPNLSKPNSTELNTNEVNLSEAEETEVNVSELSDTDSDENHLTGFVRNENEFSGYDEKYEAMRQRCRAAVDRIRKY